MATIRFDPDDASEKEVIERAFHDWLMYGEIHVTNNGGRGLTVLDPKGITYTPTGNEVSTPSAIR